MDDSCAVCADALEWVAYGPCGHREVCSTCVVRLRFVLDDRRCCICKTESPIVFVTKAMGDYTRVITDFSVFPSGATEGKAGDYWYHEGTQAYFDDVDHYRMIKAMCRLSCSVCDKNTEEQGSEGATRKRTKFRSIEQLKGHLFHQHKLFMCSLCLEGRKVFICEQKLYTRSQLNQHISTGDSEVDGSESERGGFMGHPMCEFCKNPFYGDNELYMHMTTEHYTCHICQRQHPGQYDYYRNYDDLETHFRQEHFLCENEACLAKKFVVFQAEAEMKRHNTIEHGGHMSRSKRNAALQIPTSFRYRRSNEHDQRRGRGRGFRPDQSGDDLTMAIQASVETAIADNRARDSSSGARLVSDQGETSHNSAVTGSLESLTINSGAEPLRSVACSQSSRSSPVIEESSFPPLSDWEPPEPSSRYAQALQSSRIAARLGEESFPPLPGAEKSRKPKAGHGSEGLGKNTLAARLHLRSKGPVAIRSSAWSRPSENHEIGASSSANSHIRPATNHGISLSASTTAQPRAATNQGSLSSSSAVTQVKPTREIGLMPPVSANSPWNSNAANRMRHSASAPNLIEGGSSNHSSSSMVSAVVGNQSLSTSNQSLPNVKNVHTANQSLVERIRAGLGMDEDRFAAFKNISAEYRQGLINTWEYLSYVEQFGLSHLVLELAELCPDASKRKELIDAYNANLRVKGLRENGGTNAVIAKESKKGKGKGKGKHVDHSSTTDALTDSILDTVRKLQSNLKPQEEEVETLSKDGYRGAKGKLQPSAGEAHANSSSLGTNFPDSIGSRVSAANSTSSNQNVGGGSSKQQKKTSKFHRIRLGDGSVAALLDSNASPERPESESSSDHPEGLPVRGVWRNGGGLRLVLRTQKNSSK